MGKIKQNFITDNISTIDKLLSYGLLIILLLIPILVRVKVVDFVSPLITDIVGLSTGEQIVSYSQIKFTVLVFFTAILALLFIYKIMYLNDRIKPSKTNILIAIFIIIILLSLIFAPFKSVAFFGNYNRNEGTITYLCYIILFFIASNIHIPKKTLKLFIYILVPFTIINGILVLLDFYGIRLLDMHIIKEVIFGRFADTIQFTEESRLLGTLENRNYYSGVSSMLVCTFFILSILNKNWKLKSLNILLLYLSFGILVASTSRSGFITISVLLPVFLITLIIKRKYKEFVAGLILVLSLSIIFVPMQQHDERVWNESFGSIIGLIPNNAMNNSEKPMENTNNLIQPNANNNVDEPVKEVEDDFLPELPVRATSWGSGRGYIWETTISLIAKRPVLGYGLDTYSYHFPQNDKNMMSGLSGKYIVDKPHSLYLGIAFGAGILGLIVFLIIISIPLFRSFIRIVKSKNISSELEILAITFLAIAYLIQGVVNDSVIGVSVIFYVLLGVLNSVINNSKGELN